MNMREVSIDGTNQIHQGKVQEDKRRELLSQRVQTSVLLFRSFQVGACLHGN